MTLEISEIGIRMQVGAGDEEERGHGAAEEGRAGPPRGADREEIVQDCLRRVLKVLRALQER